MTTVFRSSSIAKERLRDVILSNVQTLKPGIEIIDSNLEIASGDTIDIICRNRSSDAILIKLDVDQSSDAILSSLNQAQWICENKDILKRAFRDVTFDFSRPPKIIVVSSGFSPRTRSAVVQLFEHDITLIQYRYMIAGDQDGIHFETVLCTEDQTERVGELNEEDAEPEGVAGRKSLGTPTEKEPSPPAESVWVPLTREEEAEFLESDIDTL